MPYTAEQKEAAGRNQDRVSYASVGAGMAGVGLGFIPAVGVFVAAGFFTLSSALQVRAIQQGKIARDPPRGDFNTETTLGPPRFSVGDLPESSLEIWIADLASTTDKLTRLIEANVVAVERSDGARLAGASGSAELRSREVVRFAVAMTQELNRSSNLSLGLVRAVSDSLPAWEAAYGEQLGVFRESTFQPFTDSLEVLAEADRQWADEIRQGLDSGRFLEGLEGTGAGEA